MKYGMYFLFVSDVLLLQVSPLTALEPPPPLYIHTSWTMVLPMSL